VKSVELVAVPSGVVAVIGPVFAPVGTVAVMCVSVSTENLVAFTPPNVTFVAPVKLVPVIFTWVPTEPLGRTEAHDRGKDAECPVAGQHAGGRGYCQQAESSAGRNRCSQVGVRNNSKACCWRPVEGNGRRPGESLAENFDCLSYFAVPGQVEYHVGELFPPWGSS
jgi:hypothetical protein